MLKKQHYIEQFLQTYYIKEYIQFAIDSWYWNSKLILDEVGEINVSFKLFGSSKEEKIIRNIYDVIMSNSFIETVAQWYIERTLDKYKNLPIANPDKVLEEFKDTITIKQALAIRDWKLNLFIKEIIWE